eukprot:COSAG02_NODE_7771_length_2854_cov_7.933575_2_plen_114_part_00
MMDGLISSTNISTISSTTFQRVPGGLGHTPLHHRHCHGRIRLRDQCLRRLCKLLQKTAESQCLACTMDAILGSCFMAPTGIATQYWCVWNLAELIGLEYILLSQFYINQLATM